MTMKTKELIKRARRAEVAEPGVIVRTPEPNQFPESSRHS